MSRYWNKIVLDKLFSESKRDHVHYKINTEIGRFYFYFKKEEDSRVTGKLIFFPSSN